MKRKQIEKLQPLPPKKLKTGRALTAQEAGDVLVINIYRDSTLERRYCINCRTGEYENLKNGVWSMGKFRDIMHTGWNWREELDTWWDLKKYRKLAARKTGLKYEWDTFVSRINDLEYGYGDDKRNRQYERKVERIEKLMELVPPLPKDLEQWYLSLEAPRLWYMLKGTVKDGVQQYTCTKCGGQWSADDLNAYGEKPIHGKYMKCPGCGADVLVNKRKEYIAKKGNFMLLQRLDETRSVARHFDAAVEWGNGKRRVSVSEAVRIVFEKRKSPLEPFKDCILYQNQYKRKGSYLYLDETENYTAVWWDSNRANRKILSGYLYPDGIRETLEDTLYETWTRPFGEMARQLYRINYNEFMRRGDDNGMASAMELLVKGRFKKLVQEIAGIPWWRMWNSMNLRDAENIGEVFRLDRQRINRIRDTDGGIASVEWMQYEKEHGKKVDRDTLGWFEKNRIEPENLAFILDRMSPVQACNYVKRMGEPGNYPLSSPQHIISQWQDYLNMCERLKRKTDDEMVYRPRELKRRHDEAVAEIAEREAEITADEYSSRFPDAEQAMKEIREKYAYTGKEYMVTVPQRAVDIVLEGRALHHCAGSTDRYFNRIEDHETYICFLRKTAEPEKPFYTIEVEPGGTVRQHRGYLDEEPDIDKIRPFLREWQKAIRKRMTEEDKKRAERSAVLRAENIKELQAKNNTRVLEGLMEDFLDADEQEAG